MANEVKKRFDAKQMFRNIAEELNIGRATVASAFRYWYESRGLPVPDGRSLRQRLEKFGLTKDLQPQIMERWDNDLLIDEIAL